MADPRQIYQDQLKAYGLGLGGIRSMIGKQRSPFAEEGPSSTGIKSVKQEFSDDDIRKAIAIANHPEFKGGNHTGASNKINSMKPGLADHPKVAKALQQANENKGDK